MNLTDTLAHGDSLSWLVSVVLLAMSVSSWFLIFYKIWLLRQASRTLGTCQQVFWAAPNAAQAHAQGMAVDRQQLFVPLLDAVVQGSEGLSAQMNPHDQVTRRLREGLQQVRRRLQWGQDLLATIGATAPFVGLLGTVWGIFHALTNLATSAQYTLDKVAQPVGEALVMTAAGLAVAIPAVMAYNLMGRWLARIDLALDGWAHDLRALALAGALKD